MKKFCFLLSLFVSINVINAQSIWTNPLTTGNTTANPYTTGDVVNSSITESGIGASGVTLAATAACYLASGWTTATTINTGEYFEFTLTPDAGCNIDFVSFVYDAAQSGTGPASFAFRSSVDGYATNIGTPTSAGTTISLSAAAYQNITSAITFRLYGFKAGGSGGTFRINDFTFNGTVSCGPSNAIATPTLSTSTFNLAGCAATATATVTYSSTGTFNSGNVYTAQMSDSSGDFSSPINVGSVNSTSHSGTFTITIPSGTIAGTNYQIQIVSSNPAVTSTSASATFTINTSCVESISLGTMTPSSFTLASCAATHTATITFSTIGISSFHAGNKDSLFMSDETGDFTNEVYVGSLATTSASGTITFTVPAGSATGSLYQLQLISSNPNIESNLSSAFTITSTCIKPTITTGTLNASTYNLANCAATATGTVSFSATGTYSTGNVYTAQLSDENGDFSNPVVIGTITSTVTPNTIHFTIPAGTSAGTGYEIRIVSSKPVEIGSPSVDFTITATCVVPLCPSLTGSIINACNSDCNEGDGEVILFNTGTYSISVASIKNTAKILQYYGSAAVYSNGTGTSPNAYTGNISAQTSVTSALNSGAGCSSAFVEGFNAGTIPAGSTIMMVPSTFGTCQNNYNFSNICSGFKPIYVLYFATTSTGLWNTSGNFANYQSGNNPKYISVDFGISGCNEQYYTYNAGTENSGDVDGQAISFSGAPSTTGSAPTNAATYPYTTGCTLPVVLPITLIDFTAERLKNNINLKWTTLTESNNYYFNVEYSLNGTDFIYYTQVKGAGTSKTRKDYACVFNQKVNSSNIYFRLKQVNYNGTYTYSDIITYNSSIIFKSDLVAYYNAERDKVITHFYLDAAEFVNVSLYDVTGAKIQETGPINYSEGNNEIVLNASDKTGIYILVYQVGDAAPIHKKIIVDK